MQTVPNTDINYTTKTPSMIKFKLFFLFLGAFVISCGQQNRQDLMRQWNQEVLRAEEDFAEMVRRDGIHKAFVAFADEDAVLMRNEKLIKGIAAIDSLYKGQDAKGLAWAADAVHVSESGDLAYTYGKYRYSFTDAEGGEQVSEGVFHTVWKRQEDGSWKYVWD